MLRSHFRRFRFLHYFAHSSYLFTTWYTVLSQQDRQSAIHHPKDYRHFSQTIINSMTHFKTLIAFIVDEYFDDNVVSIFCILSNYFVFEILTMNCGNAENHFGESNSDYAKLREKISFMNRLGMLN